MADQVYTNIKVLKGLTEDQFMDTMGFISSSLGTNCIFCHDDGIGGDTHARWKAFAADTKPTKITARQMIVMVNTINKQNFAGQKAVRTCCSLPSQPGRPAEGYPRTSRPVPGSCRYRAGRIYQAESQRPSARADSG